MNCSNCNASIADGSAFCDNCGTPASAAPSAPPMPPAAPMGGGAVCPSCSAAVIPGEAFCGDCGASMSAAAPSTPPPAYAPPPSPAYSPPAGAACPQCQAAVTPGSAFCDNCGASVGAAPPPQQPPAQQPPYQPPAQQPVQQQQPMITPRLVVQATNAPISLPPGKTEIGIGREDAVSGHFPDVNLDPHGGADGGVSRSHAKLIIQGSQCFLEDLQAVNYTFVNRQKLNPGARQQLNNGDELRFGKVIVMFYTQ